MSLIKNALVYKAHLPDLQTLNDALAQEEFVECAPGQLSSIGFVEPCPGHSGPLDEHLAFFEGGVAFAARIDTKIIPSDTVKKELAITVARIQETTGRKPGKKETKEIKEAVIYELAAKAFVSTKIVRVYHHTESNTLIVPATQHQADRILTRLVKACGSVKTETIHVNDVKLGLTTRMKHWTDIKSGAFGDDGDIFHTFDLTGVVDLKRGKERVSFKVESLRGNLSALQESLLKGFNVDAIGLSTQHGGTFKLSSDLKLKSIQIPEVEEPRETFAEDAAFEVANVVGIVNDLCAMFGFPEKESSETVAPEQHTGL